MKAIFLILCAVGMGAIWLVVSPELKTYTWRMPTASDIAVTTGAATGEEKQSDEVIFPYDVMKNPFLYMDRSGILDTQHAMLVSSTGWQGPVPYPGGGLRFEKMLDERTALFQVLAGGQSIGSQGELAVILDDSNPPDTSRFWRVKVVDLIDGVNGFGAPLRIATVRFRGYYVPPAPKVTSLPEPPDIRDPSAEPSAEPDLQQTDHAPVRQLPNHDSGRPFGTVETPAVPGKDHENH